MTLLKNLQKDIYKICIELGAPKNFQPNIQKYFKKKKFDYQINGIIKLSKILNINTYTLAKKVSEKMNKNFFYQSIQITDTGFINFTIKNAWICLKINNMFNKKKINNNKPSKKIIIVDYSSPNIAKEMHVGHLRSTVLGDVTTNILKFLGYHVIQINHIGDCGAQIGMLLAYIKKYSIKNFQNVEKLYQKSQKKIQSNKKFYKISQYCTLQLQNKNPKYIKIWKKLREITIKKNQKIYQKLKIKLKIQNIVGESFYHPLIPNMLTDLKKKKIIFKKNGNLVSIIPTLKNRVGKKMGVILQKKDGSYLYATTDIACLKYRSQILKANKIIYYTDVRQTQHFKNIQNIAKRAGYLSSFLHIEHHTFGMILSKNNTPFKTREGHTIKLKHLITEAIKKTKKILQKRNQNWSVQNIDKTAEKIGIGALKYFELSKNRKKNYVFDWKQMLTLTGNTSLYIQYAYTRILSILKKNKNIKWNKNHEITINNIYEKNISIKLLQFFDIILDIKKHGTPHLLCNYLFKLSEIFSNFYENCSIISENDINIKISRIKLIILTAKIIKTGLKLLGISTVKIM
ncbi:arginine--tRNA ligase [Buchnera aphidicola]|uniref:arginine--tRNA ligase n=1 Tax=Buchnera aphidicola TaxID=9 RepID=UPI00313A9C57